MYEIVVIMMMLATDPDVYPKPNSTEQDAIRITHNDGVRLTFDTHDICQQHVWANLQIIKKFATSQFNGEPVKHIICAPVKGEV